MISKVLIIILIFLCIYLFYKNNQTKQSVKKVKEELKDMNNEEFTRRRILIREKDTFSEVVFLINKIIKKKNTKIEELNSSKEANKRILTSLAHDLRTPLTTLIGYLEAIDKDLNKEKNDEYFKTSLNKAKQLKENVNQLFEWSKLYSDDDELKLEVVDLSEATRTILVEWIPIFEQQNIYYDIEIPDNRLNGYIDEISYRTIISNLIKNIVEHAEAKKVKVNLIGREDKIIFEISDDGIGMNKNVGEKVFDKFYKGVRARGSTGSGLGLSIVKLLVEKQNGEISVNTEVNKGTTFKITFPLV